MAVPCGGWFAGASALLDIYKIRQLIEMMVDNDLVEISLRDGDTQVNLKRPMDPAAVSPPVVGPMAIATAPAQPAPVGPAVPIESDEDFVKVKSPMVGTFYSAADPESPPFVQIGSRVSPGSILCLLEAMKTFSEIKAEIAGTIERILVKNSQPVEFGQPLFLLRPG